MWPLAGSWSLGLSPAFTAAFRDGEIVVSVVCVVCAIGVMLYVLYVQYVL